MTNDHVWIAFGLTGQIIFSARFVVQWLSSEREKKSVIPPVFWYFSIFGAVILLTYAIHKQDLVFILGQSSGLFIYARNLQLVRNERRRLHRMTDSHPNDDADNRPAFRSGSKAA